MNQQMNQQRQNRVVIVGAGHGGTNAAALLRQQGFEGEVVLLSEESSLPYQRPPLSKGFLKAEMAGTELLIKPDGFYAEQDIDLRLDVRVDRIDTAAKEVGLGDGSRLGYDSLVFATGAVPRRVTAPGAGLRNVCELRTRGDADMIASQLRVGTRIVIIGGGYVGLEVAASARHHDAEPVVLEREGRVLARVASVELSAWLTDHHRQNGTQIETDADVVEFVDRGDGSVGSVVLADGRSFECDVALVGVGAIPCEELAREAGLVCDGGVLVDGNAFTGVDGVYAIGDVTRRPLHHYEGTFRLESIPSAVEQAKQAVSAILGRPAPKPELPWFWSDQFDVKVKIAGILGGIDNTVLRGDPASGKFALYHCRDERIIAVESVNSSSDFMAGKQLIERRVLIDPARLADEEVSLRELATEGETANLSGVSGGLGA